MISPTTILRFYYYITPIFYLLDSTWGQVFRIAGFGDPIHRLYYYGFCLLCGMVCNLKSSSSALIAIFESSVNMLVLLLSVMIPIISVGNHIDGNLNSIGLAGQRLFNFLLTGSILICSFYISMQSSKNK
jgi:hypothetical protein